MLTTDFSAPSSSTLRRLHDPRVSQFWDKERLLSRVMGEKDRNTIVWDHIAIYEPGKQWQDLPPAPIFAARPVVNVIQSAKQKLQQLLSGPDSEPRR